MSPVFPSMRSAFNSAWMGFFPVLQDHCGLFVLKEKVILFNWSGHGLVDLPAYDAFLSGRLVQHELTDEEIQKALKSIEGFPKP